MGLHDRISRNGDGAVVEAAVEVAHDPYAELKAAVHHACIAKLGPELFNDDPTDLNDRVYKAVTEELAISNTPLTREERRELVRQLTDDILGYGPLERYLADDTVTEIMVNGSDHVYVERAGKIERTPSRFVDDSHLMRIIEKIVSQVGRRVDEASPMVDARLPDGSRVNAIIPPLALSGPTLTIRKFSRDPRRKACSGCRRPATSTTPRCWNSISPASSQAWPDRSGRRTASSWMTSSASSWP